MIMAFINLRSSGLLRRPAKGLSNKDGRTIQAKGRRSSWNQQHGIDCFTTFAPACRIGMWNVDKDRRRRPHAVCFGSVRIHQWEQQQLRIADPISSNCYRDDAARHVRRLVAIFEALPLRRNSLPDGQDTIDKNTKGKRL